MNNLNVKKGDAVIVISGAEKGKTGVILATSPSTNKVLVEGVNVATKSLRARKAGEKSGFVKKEAPIDVSNVMIVCPACGKATRVAYKVEGDKKVRVCKKCGAILDAGKEAKEVKKEAKKKTNKAAADTAEAK